MTHALTPPDSARYGLAQAIRALPYASFTLVVAVVLTCGVGIASMQPSRADTAEGTSIETDTAIEAAPAPVNAVTAHAPARCVGCGVVESIRPLALVANEPAEFEFTVRLRDGSARVSRTVGRAKWHSGDRIMLMGGAGAPHG